jgi:predicted nucleic acid-binding protein
VIFDSTMLIDLQRETRRRSPGVACRFIASVPGPLLISFISEGEFASGHAQSQERAMRAFLHQFRVLHSSPDIVWTYSRIYRDLKSRGQLVGTNDLWIAATALVHDEPLVTRNTADFRRIPDLTVLSY